MEKYQEEQTIPSIELKKLMINMDNILQNPKYIKSEYLQNEYIKLKEIYNEVKKNMTELSEKIGENRKNIIGYVLYKLTDSDLKR